MESNRDPGREACRLDGPSDFQAWMEIIYEGREIFQVLFGARRCTHYIVNVALVEVRCFSSVLLENLLLNVANE